MATSVILLLQNNGAFATLQKLFIKIIKFQTLPKTLKPRAHPIGAPQKCWLASEDNCGSQHENVDSVRERNYALPRMMLPRSDGKVSQSNIVKSWECLSVEADVTLLISLSCNMLPTKSTFLSLRLDVLVVWPKLTRTLGKCAVTHLITFVLGTILEENERLAGALFQKQFWYCSLLSGFVFTSLTFQKCDSSRYGKTSESCLWSSCETIPLLWLSSDINLHFFASGVLLAWASLRRRSVHVFQEQ